ncbi:Polysaccharide deacetylase [Quadrisphaera sp. DSM 44207]|nr:Polysaccharide deacetylase [Quadrisphaera sp. DSM 44207]
MSSCDRPGRGERPAARRRDLLAAAGALLLAGCTDGPDAGAGEPSAPAGAPGSTPAGSTPAGSTPAGSTPVESPGASSTPSAPPPTPGTPQEVLAHSTVPVLCYHQLREWRDGDSDATRSLTTPPRAFTAQMEALRDGGRTPVDAAAVVDHLELGAPLPERPVLLTFDDGSATHHSVALPVLERLGFPGAFFPMTVVLGEPDWLGPDQVRDLDRAGMAVGAHSWDHQRMDRLSGEEWQRQLDEPAAELAEVLGRPVDLLAYPFGAWSPETLPHVTSAGYRAAFQLDEPSDPTSPLLTIRRIMPLPTWDAGTLLARLEAES